MKTPYDGRQVAEALKASMRRRNLTTSQAAVLLNISYVSLYLKLQGLTRFTPFFINTWCQHIEPRDDEKLWVQLNYLCAAADGWELKYEKTPVRGAEADHLADLS